MFRVDVSPQFSAEIDEVRLYYATIDLRIEANFTSEMAVVIERLLRFPLSYPLIPSSNGLRRALLRSFPYRVVFRVRNDVVLVLGFEHQRQQSRFVK